MFKLNRKASETYKLVVNTTKTGNPVINLFDKQQPTKNPDMKWIGSLAVKVVHAGYYSVTSDDIMNLRGMSEKEFSAAVKNLNPDIVASSFLPLIEKSDGSVFVGGSIEFRSPYSGKKIKIESSDYDLSDPVVFGIVKNALSLELSSFRLQLLSKDSKLLRNIQVGDDGFGELCIVRDIYGGRSGTGLSSCCLLMRRFL